MDLKKSPLFIFSFKAVIFTLLFLAVVGFIEKFVKLMGDARLDVGFDYLASTKDSINYDVLFFSNSYMFTAIDPLYFKHLTELENLHLGSSGQKTIFTIETIKSALKIHKPKCIVFDLSQNNTFLPRDDEGWSYNLKGIRSIKPSRSKFVTLVELFPLVEDPSMLINTYSRFLFTLSNLNKWKDFRDQGKNSKYSSGYLGYRPVDKSMHEKDSSHVNWNNTYFNFESDKLRPFFDEISRDHLIDFLEEYKNNDMEIILVSSLKLNSWSERDFLREIAKLKEHGGNNLSYINLNTLGVKEYLNFDKKDFSNSTHLSHLGAMKLTKYISPKIRKRVTNERLDSTHYNTVLFNRGLVVKDYNIVLEDFYTKVLQLYLDSIPEDYNDYTTTICIYPKDSFEHKLSVWSKKKSKAYDIVWLPLQDYYQVEGGLVGHVKLETKLKKEEIEKIELLFYKKKSFSSGRKVLYEAN